MSGWFDGRAGGLAGWQVHRCIQRACVRARRAAPLPPLCPRDPLPQYTASPHHHPRHHTHTCSALVTTSLMPACSPTPTPTRPPTCSPRPCSPARPPAPTCPPACAHLPALPSSTGPDPSKLAKRRHQIGSLYHQAKQMELEQLDARGAAAGGSKTKAETHRKYGW